MRRSCSASGSSSSRSARRSSSIAAASWRRWASGSARTTSATSAGCRSRRRAASAAIALVGGNSAGHLVDVDEPVARPAAQQVAPREADLGDLPRRAAAVVDGAQGDVADGLVADLAVDHVVRR